METYQTAIDGVVTSITTDVGIALTAGIAVLAVVLSARIGMGLLKSFISSAA